MSQRMQDTIIKAMGKRHMTVDEISKLTGYCFSRTSRTVTAIRRAGGVLRISGYRPPPGAGLWTPIYTLGSTPDAPMPDATARQRWKEQGKITPAPVQQQTWLSALGVL